jgi:RNA 2',3'-cyclic 3'-phosphodiesterase
LSAGPTERAPQRACRLFFALWPDRDGAERLLGATRALALPIGRAVAGADLHVTLCFVGAVQEPVVAALCERAAHIEARAFSLAFEALEYWPRSRVLAATCARAPRAAIDLTSALRSSARALGLEPDEQPFRPHVTLLRGVTDTHRSGTASSLEAPLPLAPLPLAPPLSLAVSRFYLARSQELAVATASVTPTARYAKLRSWPLAADGA